MGGDSSTTQSISPRQGTPTSTLMGAREVSSENEDIFIDWEDGTLREFLTSGMVF